MANIAQDKLNEIVSNLINTIENSDGTSWLKPWKNQKIPMNTFSKKQYRGLNILWLWEVCKTQQYSTAEFLTFNQIKAKKGTLNKGSKGYPVFFFKPFEINELNDATGQRERKTIPLLKTYTVFNIQDTSLEAGAPEEIQSVKDFMQRTGADIREGLEAYYSPTHDYISLPKRAFISPEESAATAFHELGHWTALRLERSLEGKFGSPEYAHEEVLVELSSALLQAHFSINTKENGLQSNSALYIKSWLVNSLKQEPKKLWGLLSESQKIYDYLIDITAEQKNQQEQAA